MRTRKVKSSGQIFYDDVYTLIRGVFIDNPNYKNGYYGHKSETKELIEDTSFAAKMILERMERIKHLIIDEDGQE